MRHGTPKPNLCNQRICRVGNRNRRITNCESCEISGRRCRATAEFHVTRTLSGSIGGSGDAGNFRQAQFHLPV